MLVEKFGGGGGGGSRGEVWSWKGGTRFCSCLGIGDGKFGVH